MMQMRLLDLFCGAGGATKGYQQAGFKVYGVDLSPQPRYIGDEFIQTDAIVYLRALMASGEIYNFNAIHASPPCQAYSRLKSLTTKMHVRLIDPVRNLLCEIGLPYVIENVEGAPLPNLPLFKTYTIMLCGNSFNLQVYRHRLFESNIPLKAKHHKKHVIKCVPQGRRPNSNEQFITVTGNFSGLRYAQAAMGIDWMRRHELSQAIPPAYTEYIGRQLMSVIHGRADLDRWAQSGKP